MVKFRSSLTMVLSALLVAGAMAVVAAPPAEAQTAKKLKCNGCVKSKNMKRTIFLGRSGKIGNFGVRDAAGNPTVNLRGGSGDVTNSLSGNGLVKAWATINPNGSVAACYRCNTSPAETRRLMPGIYEVDFTPLATDIGGRPRMVKDDWQGLTPASFFEITHGNQTGAIAGTVDSSSVIVFINPEDVVPFTVVIF